MTVFTHPERATHPILAPALPRARLARADGIWVRDARALPVLARDLTGGAVGLLLEIPDALADALDLLWAAPGVARSDGLVTASLRREPATTWSLESLRAAKMHGYRIPRSALR
ncbi:MAG: hypothetical protein EXR69_06145 [Myxococcales bacterium]|nr:hypothetical protein [Myxococcales bacterium]